MMNILNGFFFLKRTKNFSAGILLLIFATATSADLKVGDKAPDFNLSASDGKTYTLSQFRDKKPVVIAFFPKAFTGG